MGQSYGPGPFRNLFPLDTPGFLFGNTSAFFPDFPLDPPFHLYTIEVFFLFHVSWPKSLFQTYPLP